MAAALPSSEASGYSEVFRAIGGGGDITVDQFKAAVLELAMKGASEDHHEALGTIVEQVATIMDADGSGTISENEFVNAASLIANFVGGDSLFDNPDILMNVLDADGSGEVTAAELSRLVCILGPKSMPKEVRDAIAADILKDGDSNGDGKLNLEELRELCAKLK